MNGHEEELENAGVFGWMRRAQYLADRYCQDINDKMLLTPMTYNADYSPFFPLMVEVAGMHGEYVRSTDFKVLAQRFLLAMELLHEMELKYGIIHNPDTRTS